jgi:hypothetical protein
VNSALFADYVRRHRWVLASLGTLTAMVWFVAVTNHVAYVLTAMAVSIVVADVTGPMIAGARLAPMEVQVLPLSRRELSRTLWWTSTVLPVAVMATGKVVGLMLASLRGPVEAGLETIWVSSAMDFLVAGAMLATIAMVQRVTQRFDNPTVQYVLTVVVVVPILAVPFVPILLRQYLPLTWAGITPVVGGLMIAAAVLTTRAYVSTPRVTIGANPHATAAAFAAHKRSGFWWRLDGVTGLRRMALKVWIGAAFTQIATPLFFILVSRVFDGMDKLGLTAVRDFGLLPFEAEWSPHRLFMLLMICSIGVRWDPGPMGNNVLASLRHLRTLPLSLHQFNAVLLGLPLIAWVNAWVLLLGLHWVVNREAPASWRLVEFFGVYGLDCLIKAVQARYQSSLLASVPAFMIGVAALFVTLKLNLPLQLMLFMLGVAGLVAATLINRHTLTTRRAIYTPKRVRMFGMEIPGQS